MKIIRYGAIPEYKIEIAENQEGIEMVRTVVNECTVWVEFHDPCLDGKTIKRDSHGALFAE